MKVANFGAAMDTLIDQDGHTDEFVKICSTMGSYYEKYYPNIESNMFYSCIPGVSCVLG